MQLESVNLHIAAILDELERHKARLEEKCTRINTEIADTNQKIETYRCLQNDGVPPFARLSIRAAILKLFATLRPGPLTRSEIATRLENAGVQTRGARLIENISANISYMVKKGEMTCNSKKWDITPKGLQTWQEWDKKSIKDTSTHEIK